MDGQHPVHGLLVPLLVHPFKGFAAPSRPRCPWALGGTQSHSCSSPAASGTTRAVIPPSSASPSALTRSAGWGSLSDGRSHPPSCVCRALSVNASEEVDTSNGVEADTLDLHGLRRSWPPRMAVRRSNYRISSICGPGPRSQSGKPIAWGCTLPVPDYLLPRCPSLGGHGMDTSASVSRVHRQTTLARVATGVPAARSTGSFGVPGDTGSMEDEEQLKGHYTPHGGTPHGGAVGLT